MSGLKALKYAEDQLGVHSVYEEARKARATLDTTLTELSAARDEKRAIESRLTDAEMEVASDERGKHPEMSATAMDKHLKVALNQNGPVRELREKLSEVVGKIDGLECDKLIAETDIRIATGRMQELGGYLNYLAVLKSVEQSAKHEKSEKPERQGIWE